jgi:ABC-type multidrug transport system fused ATPase/permease subunit
MTTEAAVQVKPLPTIPDFEENAAIDVKNLTFSYATSAGQSTLDTPDHKVVLKDCDLQLAKGSRCLLIGANGAGEFGSVSCQPTRIISRHYVSHTRHFILQANQL